LLYVKWAVLLKPGGPRCSVENTATAATAAKGIILKNAMYIASAMIWVSVLAAHLIREQMPQAYPVAYPIHVMQPGAVINSTAVAPWEKRCGKVYVQKAQGQPDQKTVRPCLMV